MRHSTLATMVFAVALAWTSGAIASEAVSEGQSTEGEDGFTLTVVLAEGAKATVTRTPDMERYPPGTEVAVSVRPWTNWTFLRWVGAVADASVEATTVVMDRDQTLTVEFSWQCDEEYPYYDCYCYAPCLTCCDCPCPGEGFSQLVIGAQGEGCAFVSNGAAMDLGLYPDGQEVPIRAVPHIGWKFSHWIGTVADPASAETTVVVLDTTTVTAVFEEIGCTLPDDCTGPEDCCHNPCCDCPCPSEGEAAEPTGFQLTITSASHHPSEITREPVLDRYPPGSVVRLRAWHVEPRWIFNRWHGDVCDPYSMETTVIMDGDKSIDLRFFDGCAHLEGECECTGNSCDDCCPCMCESNLWKHLLTKVIGKGEAYALEYGPDDFYELGRPLTVRARPSQGWRFSHWIGDVADVTAATTTTVMWDSKTITAVFELDCAGVVCDCAVPGSCNHACCDCECPVEGETTDGEEGTPDGEGTQDGEGSVPEGEGLPSTPHSADQNGDGQVHLGELLRVVQFYNSNGLHCSGAPDDTEDGFVPGEDVARRHCAPHTSDFMPQDWRVSLSELLRLIQFYNSPGLVPCTDASDGFCPVP